MGGRPQTPDPNRLRVDFLPEDAVNLDGRIGLSRAPGGNGNIDGDLLRLRDRYHTHLLVCLLERGQFLRNEFADLGVTDLLMRAQRVGIETEWCALPDGNVPIPLDQLFSLVERILTSARSGRNVVLHCVDGQGRTGLVAACCLTALGASVDEAVRTVRETRARAMEGTTYVQCLRSFDGLWRRRALSRARPMSISDAFGREEGSSDDGQRPSSQTGLVPLSYAGAATVSFVGVDSAAEAAGVPPAAPLREGDVFYIMPGTAIWLGRGSECDVTIASNQLSRLHTMLAFVPVAEMRLVLVDLSSRNGTWIDNQEVTVAYLHPGEEFTLAKAYRFRFVSIG